MPLLTPADLNQLSEADFTTTFGSIFEHSPWVAQQTYPKKPFTDLADLHQKMCATLRASSPQSQLDLIIAHPDLGERLGALTPESTHEQASAGLNQLTQTELDRFNANNTAYKQKFGFPFVICARLNDKDTMLAAFETRLQNDRETELATALEQIEKIALLRLQSLIL
ncbi:2-oxo-4-hydroxy-4-carboxy-5-ureidoimidazoline decarboxylase [Phragmitibacter flavus]|uniref:2-oxo-4-hydroxy-4-carboxy-5-ureidoimidazoline decarboxylase n=1 Tax=Phragmitibacter flavus TaxID=2576071 RepID=A0A5R8KIS4_9BACT|nr:2-oxo-4-hydroxy-4-carboxy-5-ureidoimidazoline decarboxylase [Phragmitibacter flavus]TLD72157.1 2-oxo-4-hydroxy-4-carboxy-5-ureidoimidazoline decarboxylase [Phragmitibacter flavus]